MSLFFYYSDMFYFWKSLIAKIKNNVMQQLPIEETSKHSLIDDTQTFATVDPMVRKWYVAKIPLYTKIIIYSTGFLFLPVLFFWATLVAIRAMLKSK
jgi:hypothetical protein